jgi:rhodanese-related sulfurtransferase
MDLCAAGVMAIIGAGIGLALNPFRDERLPLVYLPKVERIRQSAAKPAAQQTGASTQPIPANDSGIDLTVASPEVRYLDLPAFREIVKGKIKGTVFDARPEVFYREGHVPCAKSLAREDFETSYGKQRSALEKDKSQLIVTYCFSSSCDESQMVADELVQLGYRRVFVFPGGWAEWTDAHLPEEKVP